MEVKDGFPDGYAFNRNVGTKNTESSRRQEKQQKVLDDLYKSVPPNLIKGEPIKYDDDGIPLIEDDVQEMVERVPTLEEQMLNTVERPRSSSQNTRHTDSDAANFFTAPPQRDHQQLQQRKAVQESSQKQSQQQVQKLQKIQKTQQNEVQMSHGSLQYHPVVKKMLNLFGLKKTPRKDLDIFNEDTGDKQTYTMTLVSEELQSWAISEGKNKVVIDADVGVLYFELLLVCCSVVAIDHIPVWDIFNISLDDEEKIDISHDPLDISLRIHKISARILTDLLWSKTIPFGDKLANFYQEKVMGKKIVSSLDREIENKVRYVCPLDECDHYEFFEPITENGVEKRYFCKFHGTELVKTVDILKELDIPLA